MGCDSHEVDKGGGVSPGEAGGEQENFREGEQGQIWHSENDTTSARLRVFLACGKDLACATDNLNFRSGKKSEMTKERTPEDRPIPKYQNLSKNLNMAREREGRLVGWKVQVREQEHHRSLMICVHWGMFQTALTEEGGLERE